MPAIKYPDVNRIDFKNYLESYTDLKQAFGNDIASARMHWLNNGKFEGRNIKILNINYRIVEKYLNENLPVVESHNPINMITSLYHDNNTHRMEEYILALKVNILNKSIKHIFIFWEKDHDIPDSIAPYLADEKVTTIKHSGRPSFYTLFKLARDIETTGIWVINNGDIVHTSDINKIKNINLDHKLLAITRWDMISEDVITIYNAFGKPNTMSQDCWVFNNTLPILSECNHIHLGEIACDPRISKIYKKIITVENPCYDLKTIHLHFQNARSQNYDVSNILEHEFNGEWSRVDVTRL